MIACTGAPSTTEEVPPPPPEEEPGAARPTDAATNAAVPWRPAWPAPGGGVVASATPTGRLLGEEGSAEVTAGEPCGDLVRIAGDGPLWMPPGDPVDSQKAPMVSAAVVERASWRLAEVGGPVAGVTPGTAEADPALHHGIRVRSVRKTRRSGPPWQVILGERRDQVLLAVSDKDATALLGGLALQRPDATPLELSALPATDLDGDGSLEVVVYGDGSSGHLRAVASIHPMTGEITLRTFETRGPITCP